MRNLWRYNRTTGYWVHVRTCAPENEQKWLKIFQADEPDAKFKIAKYKPD